MTLKTEINTPEMDERVEAAAHAYFAGREYDYLSTYYEHGQWWLTFVPTNPDADDELYSVVDAEGGDSVDGFGFELVT